METAAKTRFECRACQACYVTFKGRCGRCGAWNTLFQVSAGRPGRPGYAVGDVVKLSAGVGQAPRRQKCGVPAVDAVLGGGFVLGSSVFLMGRKGVGKSTLALAIAFWTSIEAKRPAIYISGEETQEQVCHRARRLRLNPDYLGFCGDVDLAKIDRILWLRPPLIVVDSVQKLAPRMANDFDGWRVKFDGLLSILRKNSVPALLVSQMKENGGVMGGEGVAHDCDVIAELVCPGGDPAKNSARLFQCKDKNRFGALDSASLKMGPDGLV